MKTFTTQNIINARYIQTYTGNISAYIIQAPTPYNTCYLRPLNEEESASNGVQFGLGFMIIVECDVIIEEGDKLTIENVDYTIRGVVNHNRGGVPYKRALAFKAEKQ